VKSRRHNAVSPAGKNLSVGARMSQIVRAFCFLAVLRAIFAILTAVLASVILIASRRPAPFTSAASPGST
jgi:hypothetical protein